jgi:hypothetical protein
MGGIMARKPSINRGGYSLALLPLWVGMLLAVMIPIWLAVASNGGLPFWRDPVFVIPTSLIIIGIVVTCILAWPSFRQAREERRNRQEREEKAKTLFFFWAESGIQEGGKEIVASEQERYIPLVLVMNLETEVRFVFLGFQGDGDYPVIIDLGDSERIDNAKPSNVDAYRNKNGRWFWQYESPWPRTEFSRITIGIKYKARNPFRGKMIIGVSTVDGKKEKEVPFVVVDSKKG